MRLDRKLEVLGQLRCLLRPRVETHKPGTCVGEGAERQCRGMGEQEEEMLGKGE
jgi:hypothetical protein